MAGVSNSKNDGVLHEPVSPNDGEVGQSTGSIDFQGPRSYFKSFRKGVWRGLQTAQEKKLFCICIFLMAVTLAFLIALCVVLTSSKSCDGAPYFEDSNKECQSSTCHRAARTLLESMNLTVDPCEDFYQYVCGGWVEKHPIPDDKGRYTTFDVLRDELSDKVARALKNASKENHTTAVANAATLFQGCIDEDARDAKGLDPLKESLKQFGEWPMANPEWRGTDFKWQKQVSALARITGMTPIIGLSVAADANQTSQHIIYLDQSSFGLGRNQLVNLNASKRNEEIIAAYKDFMISIGKLMYPDADEGLLSGDADDLIQFESTLAKFSKPPEEMREAKSWYHKMKVSEVQAVTENKYFKWTDFLNDIFGDFGKITDDTEVILSAADYIKNVVKLANETNPRILANYIGWITVMKLGQQTTREFRDISFNFRKVQTGVRKPPKLERICSDLLVGLLGFAVGRLYVDEHFTEDDKRDAEELVEDVRYAYKLTINKNAWMDEVTKGKALEKLESMINMMGYPSWIRNDDELNEYYKGVTGIKTDEYFSSLFNVSKSRTEAALGKWNKPTNRTHEWVTKPPVVNAFYNPSANTITFPAGILNIPFYKYGRSLALNLGGIGSVIGHEMSHGFDDQGSEFDPEGNLIDWWSKETRDKFNERAQCFRDQYSSYIEPKTQMALNGNNSVGENIADNGGLRNAFIAYKMQVLLNEGNEIIKNKKLPGISATPDQLFFIGYASIWCGTERTKSLEMTIQYDTHSPNEFRVKVPLSNSRAFSEVFNCPLGSPMNPESKCLLW